MAKTTREMIKPHFVEMEQALRFPVDDPIEYLIETHYFDKGKYLHYSILYE